MFHSILCHLSTCPVLMNVSSVLTKRSKRRPQKGYCEEDNGSKSKVFDGKLKLMRILLIALSCGAFIALLSVFGKIVYKCSLRNQSERNQPGIDLPENNHPEEVIAEGEHARDEHHRNEHIESDSLEDHHGQTDFLEDVYSDNDPPECHRTENDPKK